MPQFDKRWQIALRLPPEAEHSLQEYPSIFRQILYNRGYATPEDAKRYLQAERPPGTDPFGMIGIPQAVERLTYAIQHGEPIAVYGDYDADGVTATALMVQTLERMGAQARGYIPNRFDEGYGLNNEALDSLHQEGVRVVVSVDCGIRSLVEAEHARQLGLDLIISDHHHPGKQLPDAYAMINPKQPGDPYPDKDLAGVGVAFKLACALMSALQPTNLQSTDLLDLVALGTIADLAPLVGENRALVKDGLGSMKLSRRQGLFSLINVANLKPENITASDVGYILGPRLNAAGRLESAQAAFDLLISDDPETTGLLAQQLDNQNQERQRITREIQAQAETLALAEDPDALILIAMDPEFNAGVVGLAASRLSEVYYRPAIVAKRDETFTRASCRSIPEFHITEALDQCADLLERHGGHAAAAGFTVRNENLPELIERLKTIASEQLAPVDLRPTLFADAEIPLHALKPELTQRLPELQPTGYGNPEAVFVSRSLEVPYSRPVGKDDAHLKMKVKDRITYDAIAFRQGHWHGQMPKRIDMMYTFEKNVYNDHEYLQLNVKDIRPSIS